MLKLEPRDPVIRPLHRDKALIPDRADSHRAVDAAIQVPLAVTDPGSKRFPRVPLHEKLPFNLFSHSGLLFFPRFLGTGSCLSFANYRTFYRGKPPGPWITAITTIYL